MKTTPKTGGDTPTPSQAPLSAGAVPELPKLYANRDPVALDKAGGYHMRHRMAMTAEGLHSKGDIADELGWRDQQIDAAQAIIHAQAAEIERLKRENASALTAYTVQKRERERMEGELRNCESRIHEQRAEINRLDTALKAKQVAEADEVMRLADEYARASSDLDESIRSRSRAPRMVNRHDLRVHVAFKAAREALRAAFTKDRT